MFQHGRRARRVEVFPEGLVYCKVTAGGRPEALGGTQKLAGRSSSCKIDSAKKASSMSLNISLCACPDNLATVDEMVCEWCMSESL